MTDPKPSKAERRRQRAEEAARQLAEQQARERRRRWRSIGGVVAALALIVGGAIALQQYLATEPTAAASEHSLAIGDPEAPRQVVIYEDFLCPHCAVLEEATADGLSRAAAEGKVHVEYRPFELLGRLGDYSGDATATFAVVLETAGTEVAKEYHDLLFDRQPPESGPFPDRDVLVELAAEAGADPEEVRAGLADGTGEEWTDAATEEAADAGVQGTPTVFLDGELYVDGRDMTELGENLVDEVG